MKGARELAAQVCQKQRALHLETGRKKFQIFWNLDLQNVEEQITTAVINDRRRT
jgi:hypothetical protein